MCMLTKRTNILFDKELWRTLTQLAQEKETSVGHLVRKATEEKYAKEYRLEQRRKVVEAILRHRPAPAKEKIDYKALINAGRKNY